MNRPLDCEIVRDLLPSYVDGLTGDATNKAMEEHMALCPDCAAALNSMREPEPVAAAPAAEVDYLKKVRRRSTGRSLVIAAVLMLLGMSLLGYRYFYIGRNADPTSVACRVAVEGDTVTVSGTLADSGLAVARVTFSESAGIVQMKVYTALKMFFNSGDLSATYKAQGDVGQVRINDLIIWDNGVEIGPVASRLFAETNPFIGDMPQNGRIAAVLGVSEQFGPYTNELQTDAEPYGWTLILDAPIATDEESAARDVMAADSCAMLAVIENLSYVTWRYGTDAGAREYTLTAEDASSLAGGDIKSFASSAASLQKLTASLSFRWSGVRETPQEDGTFYLSIRNDCGADIYSIGISYYLAGKLIGSMGYQNADGSPLRRGDEEIIAFTPAEFPEGATAAELLAFSFDLTVTDGDGNTLHVRENVPVAAKYAWTYFYTLSDTPDGLALGEG